MTEIVIYSNKPINCESYSDLKSGLEGKYFPCHVFLVSISFSISFKTWSVLSFPQVGPA